MPEIRLLIFDLDGTLVDSAADIAAAVNHTLEVLGEPRLPAEAIRDNVGDGVLELLRRCLVRNHPDRIREAVATFREYYGAHLTDRTRLYPGVPEMLERFSHRAKAVLTNKPERFAGPILEGLGVRSRFHAVLGGDGTSVPKPSAEPVHGLLERFDCEPGRAVIIGDSPVDVETGRLAGILTCAVTYGYRSRAELEAAAPDFLAEHPRDLVRLLA